MRTDVAIVVGIYFCLLIGWGLINFIRNNRKEGVTLESQFIGQRSFGFGRLLATLVAAWASNYTLLAAAESGFTNGISGPIWYALGVALPILFFVWPVNIVAKIREAMPHGVTIVEYVGKRYDEKSRVASLIIVLISNILYLISVVMAIGIVLASLLNIKISTATIIGGAVLVIYTALGGFEGVVWTHVYQLVLAGLSIMVALILTIQNTGFSGFVTQIPEQNLNALAWGPLQMVDFFLALTALTIASPVIWQRIFSAKDSKSAEKAIWWFGPVWAPFAVGAGLIGMAAFMLMPEVAPSESATRFVMELFPNWAAVLFLLGGMALVFSSGDATVNNIASILQFDIIKKVRKKPLTKKQNLYVSFLLQIVLGVFSIAGALGFSSILGLLVLNSAVNIALIFPLYLGLVWKGTSSNGAFWSMILSISIGGTMLVLDLGPVANLTALIISVSTIIGISYLSKNEQIDLTKRGEYSA
ncbi:sodium:solute symporter family protein [Salirhabdus salicampi]|uniref:sodium:solute symporter family protein n=1 Tax=Salirhabdus salicampi TaxID=476102 RepID=UPI0020C4324D|nr:sodium:solute symporter family protein [Salirhabdus salicampi]MCP8617834.1 sodium:solute symporter family protein [Salirhabdus salicampi]